LKKIKFWKKRLRPECLSTFYSTSDMNRIGMHVSGKEDVDKEGTWRVGRKHTRF